MKKVKFSPWVHFKRWQVSVFVSKQVCPCSSTFKITASGAVLPSRYRRLRTRGPVARHHRPFCSAVCEWETTAPEQNCSPTMPCWQHYLATWRSLERTTFTFSRRVSIASYANGTAGAVTRSTLPLVTWDKGVQWNWKYFESWYTFISKI